MILWRLFLFLMALSLGYPAHAQNGTLEAVLTKLQQQIADTGQNLSALEKVLEAKDKSKEVEKLIEDQKNLKASVAELTTRIETLKAGDAQALNADILARIEELRTQVNGLTRKSGAEEKIGVLGVAKNMTTLTIVSPGLRGIGNRDLPFKKEAQPVRYELSAEIDGVRVPISGAKILVTRSARSNAKPPGADHTDRPQEYTTSAQGMVQFDVSPHPDAPKRGKAYDTFFTISFEGTKILERSEHSFRLF